MNNAAIRRISALAAPRWGHAVLATFLLAAAPALAQPAATALGGAIPAPDEQHASHPIGVCGRQHFEPRLEFCDSRDNHVYRYVRIGSQTWMAENLGFGVAIPGSQDQLRPGQKYCLYDMGSDCAALYQWSEAVGLPPKFNITQAKLSPPVQGVCPAGWHLPSAADFATLIALVDKEQGRANEATSLMYFSHDPNFRWKTNTDPDSMMPRDRYGFEAISTGIRVLKAGCPVGRGNDTWFCNAHDRSMFWTSDDTSVGNDPNTAIDYSMTEDIPQLGRDDSARNPMRHCDPSRLGPKACVWKPAQKVYGMSVRCLRNG